MAHGVKERPDVGVEDEVHLPALECDHERIECIVRAAAGPEPVAEPEETFLVDSVQHSSGRSLDDFVLKGSDRTLALFSNDLGALTFGAFVKLERSS